MTRLQHALWSHTPLLLRLIGYPTFRRRVAHKWHYSWHGQLQHIVDQLGED